MIQNLLKVSLLLFGYLVTGIGALSLIAVFKFMLDVFPELLYAQVFGLLMAVLGLWVLGKYDKIFTKRDKWYSDKGY